MYMCGIAYFDCITTFDTELKGLQVGYTVGYCELTVRL